MHNRSVYYAVLWLAAVNLSLAAALSADDRPGVRWFLAGASALSLLEITAYAACSTRAAQALCILNSMNMGAAVALTPLACPAAALHCTAAVLLHIPAGLAHTAYQHVPSVLENIDPDYIEPYTAE